MAVVVVGTTEQVESEGFDRTSLALPSRLPTTWPRREEDCPVLEVRPVDGTLAYGEDVFIGYRGWSRTAARPLFAFGSGQGYTTWAYGELAHTGTEVRVTLTNTGERPGREVVQVYLSANEPGPVERPERWLAGFATATAAPGETVTVTIPLPERAFQVWDDGWRTVPGDYTVTAAHALDDPRLTGTLTVG